jgi:NADPH:quinone reductase-like Zn-dependent oxidoreductase
VKAYALVDFDTPPDLIEVAVPQPGTNEILIKVLATSINPVDAMVVAGFFRTIQPYRFPAVVGRDVCGVVAQVGSGVTEFAVGDSVFGFIKREYIGDGTFAEYVTSPSDYFVVPRPKAASPVEAGVLGLSSITAQECLDELAVKAGDTVLVNGATGGVGSFAVQLAVDRGLRVIATARGPAGADYVRGLGAVDVVDWTGDLESSVRKLAPDGVDGLVDLVRRDASTVIGMDETPAQREFARFARSVVRPGGSLTSLTNGANPEYLGDLIGTNVHSSPTPEALRRIADAVERGALRAPICAVYPFERIAEAFARQRSGVLGKVAVVVDPENRSA